LDSKDVEHIDTMDNLDNRSFNESQKSHDEKDATKESSFHTSTPKKSFEQCEDCMENSECTDCIVKHMLGRHGCAKVTFC
jgi:hypothetical protein